MDVFKILNEQGTTALCRKVFFFSIQHLRAKQNTYKIISHQKLYFIVFSCVATFIYQGLYVLIHVDPLDGLFYLLLALKAGEVATG